MAPSRNNNKNDALSLVRKAGNRRKANRDITSRSRRDNNTTPETIDITNSDSDDEDDIVMEDNQIMEVSSCFLSVLVFSFSCRFNRLFLLLILLSF